MLNFSNLTNGHIDLNCQIVKQKKSILDKIKTANAIISALTVN